MILWRGTTESEEIFKAHLKELGVNASYTEVDAKQNRGKLAASVRALDADFSAKRFDIVYTHGTSASQVTLGVLDGRLPAVFDIVFDPVGGNLVKSLQKPGVNVTGATNGVPVAQQLDAFQRLSPFKSLCLLFNPREFNSNIILHDVRAWGEQNDVAVTVRRVVPDNDSLPDALEEIRSGNLVVDVVYAGADSFVSTRAAQINAAIGDKVRLFGGTETFILEGAWLATYAPSLQDMGRTAAEQAKKVIDGHYPGDLPVLLPPPRLIISRASAAQHGVAVPTGALAEK
jgi:putative ABC transport system substrate-binding protein